MHRLKALATPQFLIAILFIFLGAAFIRKTGIHYDASYELGCFYSCMVPAFRLTLAGASVPVMVLPYLGALKTWLYWPLLHFLEITPMVLRLPTLLIGAVSVWLSFCLLDRISGRRAAVAGSLLLATDATFLLATTYDFGPVALLHCLALGGILLLLRFDRTGATRDLALAFFLFGLALWQKALFIWMLDGLVVASIVVMPRRIWALFSPRRLAVAVLSLLIGALPLLYFNVVRNGATLNTGSVMSGSAPLAQKVLILRQTLNGSIMFGWLTEENMPETTIPPTHATGKAAAWLNTLVGSPRSNLMLEAFLISCCLISILWSTKARGPSVFVLVYILATWLQMIVLPNTGATLHHVILIWPFPQLLIAIVGAQLSHNLGRHGLRIAAVMLAGSVGSNLALVNHYYTDLATRGTTLIWTDAIYPLFDYLETRPAGKVVMVDWGYATTVCLLSDGEMPFHDVSFLLLNPSPTESDWIRTLIRTPGAVFVDHTEGAQVFPGVRQRLATIAQSVGARKEVVKVIEDRNHRPRFEIARYVADQ